jgi:hypothetical protein
VSGARRAIHPGESHRGVKSGSGWPAIIGGVETYRIVVKGRLSERFASAFCGMTLESRDGTTALVGDVADQSHLFGLLERVRSLGLELVRVEPGVK